MAYDELTELAAHVCATPIAWMSLIDSDRQWYIGRVGFTEHDIQRARTFCSQTIESSEILEIADAATDERFQELPLEPDAPKVRFYAGVPLQAAGRRIGALCVADSAPRTLDASQRTALIKLARLGERLIAAEQAGHRLALSEKQMDSLTQRLDLVLWSSNGSVEIADYVSKSFEQIWGWNERELSANPHIWFEAIIPEDQSPVKSALMADLKARRIDLEYRIRRKDGELRWIRDRVHREHDAQGRIVGLSGVAEDVTDQKRLSDAYVAHQRHTSELLNSITGFVGVFNLDGSVRFINKYPLELSGESLEAVINQPLWETIWWNYDKRVQQLTRDSIVRAALGERVRAESVARTVGDGRITFDLTFGPSRDSSGQIESIVGFGIDITRRKQIELMLHVEHDFTEAVIENADAIVVVLDRDGRIQRFNKAAERTSGFTGDEVVGKYVWETVLPPEHSNAIKDEAFTALMKHPEHGRTAKYVNEWVAKNGSRRLIEWNNSIMRDPEGISSMVAVGIDITERRQTEIALRRSEEHLRSIVESEPECIKIIDDVGRVVEMNPAGLRIIGAENLEQIRGRDLIELVVPEYREKLRTSAAAVFNGETRLDTFEIISFGGSRRWLEQHSVPLRDPENPKRIIQLLAVTRDITDRMHAEQATRINDIRLKEAQQIARIGSWELDCRTGHLFWTDEVFALMGIEPDKFEVTYEAFLASVHPDDRDVVHAAYTQSLQRREPYCITHRLRMPNERIKWVEERCRTEFGADGTPLFSRGTIQDITERVVREQEISDMRDRLQQIIDASPDWIFAKDLNHRYVLANNAFAQAHGRDRRHVIGLPDTDFWSAELCDGNPARGIVGFHNEDRLVFRGESVHTPRNIFTRSDGSVRIFDTIKSPMYSSVGQINGILCYSRDITDTEKSDRLIRTSLAEKELLLREIHHRVKNNLQVITSLLHFQGKRITDPKALEIFAEARNRLRSIILVHEKLYSSNDLSVIDFSGYVQALVDQLAKNFASSATIVDFRIEASPLSLPIQTALPCGMILAELVINVGKYAFPHTDRGKASVRIHQEGDWACLTVHDEGVGLPPGFNLDQSTTFGWHLIRSLVDQLSGRLELGNGPGTCVHVHFPVPAFSR